MRSWIDTLLSKHLQSMLAVAALGGQQQQARGRYGAEDPRPKTQHRIVDFAEVVQAAKGDETAR